MTTRRIASTSTSAKRTCTRCKIEKDLTEANFYWSNYGKRFNSACKDCVIAYDTPRNETYRAKKKQEKQAKRAKQLNMPGSYQPGQIERAEALARVLAFNANRDAKRDQAHAKADCAEPIMRISLANLPPWFRPVETISTNSADKHQRLLIELQQRGLLPVAAIDHHGSRMLYAVIVQPVDHTARKSIGVRSAEAATVSGWLAMPFDNSNKSNGGYIVYFSHYLYPYAGGNE